MLLRRHVAALTVVIAVTGCDQFDTRPAPASSASAAPAIAGSAAAGAPSAEAQKLARAAADAALAVAKQCIVWVPPFDDAQDECSPTADSVKALETASAALDAHAKAHPDEVRGAIAPFVKTVGFFAGWVTRGALLKRMRGTLKLFQDVADTWNAHRPSEPIPVDPVEEHRLSGYGSKGYIMKPMPKTNGRVVWKSCYDGPCLWENHW